MVKRWIGGRRMGQCFANRSSVSREWSVLRGMGWCLAFAAGVWQSRLVSGKAGWCLVSGEAGPVPSAGEAGGTGLELGPGSRVRTTNDSF